MIKYGEIINMIQKKMLKTQKRKRDKLKPIFIGELLLS